MLPKNPGSKVGAGALLNLVVIKSLRKLKRQMHEDKMAKLILSGTTRYQEYQKHQKKNTW